jgi:hypothetical protein
LKPHTVRTVTLAEHRAAADRWRGDLGGEGRFFRRPVPYGDVCTLMMAYSTALASWQEDREHLAQARSDVDLHRTWPVVGAVGWMLLGVITTVIVLGAVGAFS